MLRNTRRLQLLAFLILLTGSTVSFADSFRCGIYLTQEGMPSSELVEICGEPDLVKTSEEPIIVERPDGTTFTNGVMTTHHWYYERGPNEFVARVTIRESVAEEIELLAARLIEALELD